MTQEHKPHLQVKSMTLYVAHRQINDILQRVGLGPASKHYIAVQDLTWKSTSNEPLLDKLISQFKTGMLDNEASYVIAFDHQQNFVTYRDVKELSNGKGSFFVSDLPDQGFNVILLDREDMKCTD